MVASSLPEYEDELSDVEVVKASYLSDKIQ